MMWRQLSIGKESTQRDEAKSNEVRGEGVGPARKRGTKGGTGPVNLTELSTKVGGSCRRLFRFDLYVTKPCLVRYCGVAGWFAVIVSILICFWLCGGRYRRRTRGEREVNVASAL